MKTATVRDLRNNFADLAKQIEWGEQITITRNGEPFAILSPVSSPKARRRAWAERMRRYTPVGRKATRAETDALWSRLRD